VRALFDTVTGCKFNMIRLPSGAATFRSTATRWTIPSASTSHLRRLQMNNINIEREKPMNLAFIKKALVSNPGIKVWGSPWTAPAG